MGMEQIKFSTFTQGVMGFTFGGGYLCAFLWGIFQLHNHEITFGTMTAFLQLVGQVQGPFLGLISIPPSLIRGWTSVERLMALFEDVEPDEHPVYIDQPLTLNFRKVSFGYEEGQPVLDRFTAAFHPGSSTAIAGPTGTGKTTIIRLILALVYPEKGRIDLTTEKHRHADGLVSGSAGRQMVLSGSGNGRDADGVAADSGFRICILKSVCTAADLGV